MLAALKRDGLRVKTVVLNGGPLPAVRARIVLVDTIAATLAAPHLQRLRAGGMRVIALAQMRRGAHVLARRADRVIAVGAALAHELELAGVRRSAVTVVRPGCDGVPLRPRSRSRGIRVLCVANWTFGKGVHTLLSALARLSGVSSDLVGDHPDPGYAERVRALSGTPRLRDRVHTYGSLRGVALARRYAAASIFALPSVREGYPIVYAEALAHALPIVACDIPAVREVTDDAALLVPPGRVRPLADALGLLIRDERRRAELARRARARARRLPTWSESQRAFVDLIRAELGEHRHRPRPRLH